MGEAFRGSDIVELGIEIERNGRDFYQAVHDRARNEKAKKLFGFLKEAEEEHIADFRKLLGSVSSHEPQEAFPQEYTSYMNALAGDHVFTRAHSGSEVARKVTDDQEAVTMAIGFEKDSIIFYVAMKEAVPAADRPILDELIRQEQTHLGELLNMLGEVTEKKGG